MGLSTSSDDRVIQAPVDDYLDKKGNGKSRQKKRSKGKKKKSNGGNGGEYDDYR